MTSREHIRKVLASAVSGYIAATDRSDTQLSDICEALSRLTQEFLSDNPSWDSRSTWLDGLRPSRFDVRDGALQIAGGVFVIVSGATFIAPLAAILRADEVSLTTLSIHFGNATADLIPYDARFSWSKLSFPDEASNWRYLFDLDGCLPRSAPLELPESSNFYASLPGATSPRQVADLYRRAGWATRACGWHEFEVRCDVAELVIEATPVLLHGAVAQPDVNLDAVVAPLSEAGVAFSCECYAHDGSLILQRTST
jgi:hypothetical protein